MKEVTIYGIGKCGRKYIDDCLEKEISGMTLVDSDSRLWGTAYRGMEICAPQNIEWTKDTRVVLTLNESNSREVKEMLTSRYGILESQIIHYSETFLSDGQEYNWGDINLAKQLPIGEILTVKEIAECLAKDSLNKLERFFFFSEHKMIYKWLHYFEAYDRFFHKFRGKDITILEIGVFRGGSLQMWKDYFQEGGNKVTIYGIDIDPECKQLEEDDINILIGSQDDPAFLKRVRNLIGKADIIIDDGGHTMNQQITSFEELFELVSDDGIYLCEDLHTSYMQAYGGEYKGNTFIEYAKNLIDDMHAQYSETSELKVNKYSEQIKAISFWDSMCFIEKKKRTTKSFELRV